MFGDMLKIEEIDRDRKREIGAGIMLRVCNGRSDGCFVGISNAGDGKVKVCLYSPYRGNGHEAVTGDTIPADELVDWLAIHQDY